MKVEIEFDPSPCKVSYEFLVQVAKLLKDSNKLRELAEQIYNLAYEDEYSDYLYDVKLAIIENLNTTEETLFLFIKDEDEEIRAKLASISSISEDIMDVLSKDSDKYVLRCLLQNPKCNKKIYDNIVETVCTMYTAKYISTRVDIACFIKKIIEHEFATDEQIKRLSKLLDEKPIKHATFNFFKGVKA